MNYESTSISSLLLFVFLLEELSHLFRDKISSINMFIGTDNQIKDSSLPT